MESPWWPHARFEEHLPGEELEAWRAALRWADRGEWERAVEALQALLSRRPDFVPAMSKLGALHAERGRARDAQDWTERALSADPHYPPALNNRGNLLLEAGDAAGATDLYRRALQVDPDYAVARHNLAVALKRQGDVEGFVREFKRSQRLRVRQDAERTGDRSRRSGCLGGGVGAALLLFALVAATASWL